MNIKTNIENIEDYENEISSYVDVENLAEQNEKSLIIQNMIDSIAAHIEITLFLLDIFILSSLSKLDTTILLLTFFSILLFNSNFR